MSGQTKAQYLASLADTACKAILSDVPEIGALGNLTIAHIEAVAVSLHAWSHERHPTARFSVSELRAAIVRRALRGDV